MALTTFSWTVPELLPHSGSMVLIDDLVGDGPDWVIAGVRIGEDNMFYEPGVGMPCWLGIEYMAQAIALYSGLQAKRRGDPVKIGLLLGTRRFSTEVNYFPLGSYLHIHAKNELCNDAMASFACEINEDDRCLAQARINVYNGDINGT